MASARFTTSVSLDKEWEDRRAALNKAAVSNIEIFRAGIEAAEKEVNKN